MEAIRSLVKSDLEATDQFIYSELLSDISLIKKLVKHILGSGGKRIRPLLVVLAAKAFAHEDHQHINLAAAIELIHTATLLHDDVVDNSTLRRGKETSNQVFGNEASVLVGDYLYSRAFQVIVGMNHPMILDIFAKATHLIAEGEVLQLMNCHNPDTTEDTYYHVIERKTAKLFEVACQIGAAVTDCSEQQLNAMQRFGLHIGIAYQLVDDALDYSASPELTGKNLGDDLKEGKPTLPLIYALQKGTPAEIKIIRDAIKNGRIEDLSNILSILESTQAIEYTLKSAEDQIEKAISDLNVVPASPYRQGLYDLANFIVARNH